MLEMNYKGLSVCVITRDQRDKLIKCLTAVKTKLPGAETVVLDTGSRDGSVKAALEFTSNVSDFNWCDDFSKAKNACIEKASNDLVLVLDTDEYVDEILAGNNGIMEGSRKYPEAAGRIKRKNSYVNEQGYRVSYDEWINRLFDRRIFHYEGRIHEQVALKDAPADKKYDYQMYRLNIGVFHDGYDLSPEEKAEKAKRNAVLLKKEIEENEGDPYLYYQLGKTYFNAGDKGIAAENLLKALELKPDPGMEYLSDLFCLAGYAFLDSGKAAEGLKLLEPCLSDKRYAGDADFMFIYAMLQMNNTRFNEARESFIKCTALPPSATEGTASYLAWYNAGVISEVLGEKERAMEYYIKAGDFEGARQGLSRLKDLL